jgi:predicted S18 family serine protease
MDISHQELQRLLDSTLERHLWPIKRALRLIGQEEHHMDQTGEALQQEIAKLGEDVAADNAAIVAGGEAVASAATKFAELKGLLEKQAQGALSDDEATQLTALASEVDEHLGEGTTQLTQHVAELNEASSAA